MAIDDPLYFFAFILLRFLQIVMALTVCGLYGVDLHTSSVACVSADARWIFAEVVAGLSALTGIGYLIPNAMRKAPPELFGWDVIVFLLWAIMLGIFGKVYLNEDPYTDPNIKRMKNAVWMNLANMVLWSISMVAMTTKWWKARKAKKEEAA